jgi:long-chain acyl-CoA synthetase
MKVNFFIFENKSLADLRLDKSIKTGALGKKIFCQSIESEDNLPDLFFRINPAFIRFSSGTTGASKGVVLSHETILERTAAANRAMRITHKDKIIWVLSMSFHFVVTILLFLRKGATIILSSQDFPENLLANLKKYKATVIYASPVHYNLLSSLSSCKKIFLSKVRLAISTAVSLPEAIAEKFAGKFGFELSEAYGIIEVGLPALNSSGDKSKRGSVGKASLSFKIKVADKYSNGIGRILITGRGMLDAYFSPWRMRREILTRGWFDTGDLGRIDKDGYLFIVGRGKNVINFNGMKIFPSEVEEVLIRHPQIKEVLVYGVSHPQYGQLPVAKIVLNDQKQSKISIEDLRVFAYRYLSVYKVPKEFHVVSVLPKTASGKVEIS